MAKFEVVRAIAVDGTRYPAGSTVELSADQAKAFGTDYVKPAKGRAKTEKAEAPKTDK